MVDLLLTSSGYYSDGTISADAFFWTGRESATFKVDFFFTIGASQVVVFSRDSRETYPSFGWRLINQSIGSSMTLLSRPNKLSIFGKSITVFSSGILASSILYMSKMKHSVGCRWEVCRTGIKFSTVTSD